MATRRKKVDKRWSEEQRQKYLRTIRARREAQQHPRAHEQQQRYAQSEAAASMATVGAPMEFELRCASLGILLVFRSLPDLAQWANDLQALVTPSKPQQQSATSTTTS